VFGGVGAVAIPCSCQVEAGKGSGSLDSLRCLPDPASGVRLRSRISSCSESYLDVELGELRWRSARRSSSRKQNAPPVVALQSPTISSCLDSWGDRAGANHSPPQDPVRYQSNRGRPRGLERGEDRSFHLDDSFAFRKSDGPDRAVQHRRLRAMARGAGRD